MPETTLLAARTPATGVFAFARPNSWLIIAILIALLVIIPVVVIF